MNGSTRRDAHQDALLSSKATGHGHGIGGRDLNDLVDDVHIAVVGDEASADALDLVRPRLATRHDWRLRRLDSDGLDILVLGLEKAGAARNRSTSANSTKNYVHLAISLFPDLRSRGLHVNLNVVRVVELLRHPGVLSEGGKDVFGLLDRSLHCKRAGCEDELGPEGLEHDAPLERHGLGHHKSDIVALSSRHHSQPDAGVS
mmetsp:Transcript_44493/g.140382  ORF Transcript_44493/g.140382 Transcript_44493/m.140382 type:complete len:202 (-) Transcript_44493:156-761(-)